MMPNRDHDSLQSAKLLLIEFLRFTRLLQIMLQKRSIIFGTCVLGAGVIHTISSLRAIQHKEVTLEYRPDALQQNRVDALTLEDVIHVGAVAVQLLCKPRNATPLTAQLFLNFFPDVYHHSRPDLWQQFPVAHWLYNNQHETRTSSLQPIPILDCLLIIACTATTVKRPLHHGT